MSAGPGSMPPARPLHMQQPSQGQLRYPSCLTFATQHIFLLKPILEALHAYFLQEADS